MRILTGVLQDADDNSYHRVVRVFAFLGCAAMTASFILAIASTQHVDLARLQWSRKKRLAKGDFINERKLRAETTMYERNKRVSYVCFGLTMLLMAGGWTAYFWGVATGNNS